MSRFAGLCAAFCLLVAGLTATPALAAGGNPILNDCQVHGQLTHNYTVRQLQHALVQLPAALKQYGDCYDVIQTALVRARKGQPIGTVSGGGGSFLPTPVIIVLAVLVACALAFTVMALRARGRGGPGEPPDPPAAE